MPRYEIPEYEQARDAIKDFFQGKWLGHPLHPALVHIPAGLWPAALVFDLIAFFRPGNNAVVQTAYGCLVVGIVVAALAAPTGLADWSDIRKEKPARKIGLIHMALNSVVLVLLILTVALRTPDFRTAETVTFWQLLLNLAANGVLAVSGYLGGRMVYEHGIGVARQSKHEWREAAIRGNANVPAEA
jgi:uncharacterized membrane protein